eukprot:2309627-Prymnesium_polylepis.1
MLLSKLQKEQHSNTASGSQRVSSGFMGGQRACEAARTSLRHCSKASSHFGFSNRQKGSEKPKRGCFRTMEMHQVRQIHQPPTTENEYV